MKDKRGCDTHPPTTQMIVEVLNVVSTFQLWMIILKKMIIFNKMIIFTKFYFLP